MGRASPPSPMNMLYAGDSAVGGSANYLLGILRGMHAKTVHIPPSETLSPRLLSCRYDAIILSDFPAERVSRAAQRAIARQVEAGAGLLMIGGWGSFSGPSGGWRGSLVETLLPVRCLDRDDRLHFPSGALLVPSDHHEMFRALSFENPPVLCGLNVVQPRRGSRLVLAARAMTTTCRAAGRPAHVTLGSTAHPLLVVDANPWQRVAALTTDLAPHWCGGLVDWGSRRVTLAVNRTIRVEVGDRYLQLVRGMLKWLTRAPQDTGTGIC